MNKIDKAVARLIKRKKEKPQGNKTKNGNKLLYYIEMKFKSNENVSQFIFHKVDLKEMDKFQNVYNLLQITSGDINK